MATRSPGAAPTLFTAETISSRLTPESNLNMRPCGCSTCTSERGVTTVSPWENPFGWLTSSRSVIVTASEPCVTAAGRTRTLEPITTVPVRELTITRAGASPGSTSICSRVDT